MITGVPVTFVTSYSTPSTFTVMLPVAFSGKSTLMVLLDRFTSTETSVTFLPSTFNDNTFEVLAKYLSLPSNSALIVYVPLVKSFSVIVPLPPTTATL